MYKLNFKIKEAVDVFDSWAKTGKDEGMKKNHFPAFQEIKKIIKDGHKGQKKNTLADVGCGNGWATDNLEKEKYISQAFGYDGSLNMIKKAQANYPDITFSQGDLNFWSPNQKFDIIYSMEVIYYLKSPEKFIQECYKNWLNPGGMFIAGIDHYSENLESLSRPSDLRVEMKTKTTKQWKNILEENQFSQCKTKYFNASRNWNGTLIMWGIKNAL